MVAALALPLALPSQVPSAFTFDVLTQQDITRPGDMCFLADGRVLIADLPGEIRMFVESAGPALTTVGTVPNVAVGGERGLLSVIADPGFAVNGNFYVFYTSSVAQLLHVDRFTCTGDLSDPTSTNLAFSASSRRAVLELPMGLGGHNGGSVRFGPDGKLYVTVGDGDNPCAAQDILSQSGCLLRIDCSQLGIGASAVPPPHSLLDPGDNPLSGKSDFRRLVLGIGLRNPFRMEIDPLTGNLYISDVGDASKEEMNEYRYKPGAWTVANFGWPWREGDQAAGGCSGTQPVGLHEPIMAYGHGLGGGRSIINGACYRNQGAASDFGPDYEGCVFFQDIFLGDIQRLVKVGGVWQLASPVAGQPSPTAWASGFQKVVSLRVGPDGALWFLADRHSFLTPILGRVLPTPTRTVQLVSGDGQIGPAGEALSSPLVVQVLDLQGAPLAGAPVYFTPGPGAAVSTANPVVADANGLAQTTVTAPLAGGGFSVRAASPSSVASAAFDLFARRIDATMNGPILTLSIDNRTSAPSPQVPYVVLLSWPGSPVLPTIMGPLCIDPAYAGAVMLEDGTGLFGSVSFSGAGGVGNPGLVRSYLVPPGLFMGLLIHFQAVGIDSIDGWFRTNCESYQY